MPGQYEEERTWEGGDMVDYEVCVVAVVFFALF